MPTEIPGPNPYHDELGQPKPLPHPVGKTDAENPGYEITDVNTRGIVVFLAGMMAFLVVFFVLCWAMGKAINVGLKHQDNDEARRTPMMALAGGSPKGGAEGENLASNAELEQRAANAMAQTFPTPRLDADDSNQQTADLHAREDLLLEHYTAVEPGQGERVGAVRIPIERAMQLIVQRGLPLSNGGGGAAASAPAQQFAGDRQYQITAPLTDGFARTSYELDQIESREQKMRLTGGEGKPAAVDTQARLEGHR